MSFQPESDLPSPPLREGDGEVAEGETAPSVNGTEPPAEAGRPSESGSPADAGSPAEGGSGEILPDAVALAAERDEYLAALQRTQADFANYRKRVLRQQEEQAGRAATELVRTLLPVLDTLDLAVAHVGSKQDGESASAEGGALRQARGQLIDTLSKEGLERIDEVGVAFDLSVHDAVAHAPEEEGSGGDGGATIDEVMRAGYRWRGQTLRPAMVRVRG